MFKNYVYSAYNYNYDLYVYIFVYVYLDEIILQYTCVFISFLQEFTKNYKNLQNRKIYEYISIFYIFLIFHITNIILNK